MSVTIMRSQTLRRHTQTAAELRGITIEIKSLLKFMNVFFIEKGFVVTEELEDEELVDGKRIMFVPLWR